MTGPRHSCSLVYLFSGGVGGARMGGVNTKREVGVMGGSQGRSQWRGYIRPENQTDSFVPGNYHEETNSFLFLLLR